jgi:hypothetical protein
MAGLHCGGFVMVVGPVILPLVNISYKGRVTGLPLPPFYSLRVITGLVSEKVVKIELASDRSGATESKGCVSHFSLSPPPRSVLLIVPLSPSRPAAPLLRSTPLRDFHHKERTDMGDSRFKNASPIRMSIRSFAR